MASGGKKRAHPLSSADPPPHPEPQPSFSSVSPPSLELEHFEDYVNYRILDGIGSPGVYRKFIYKRRDQGLDWAVQKCARIAEVQAALRTLAALEQVIKSSHTLSSLHVVWQHVVESNTPPSDLQLTIATCAVTRKPNVPCVVIRSKGRGAANFHVSSKYATFLYHLWVVYKIDILIKVYTRRCLELVDPESTRPIADVVHDIKIRDRELSSIARSLHAAYTHVTRSAVGGLLAVV